MRLSAKRILMTGGTGFLNTHFDSLRHDIMLPLYVEVGGAPRAALREELPHTIDDFKSIS